MVFTLPELLSVLGLAQCVAVLVYMIVRAGNWRLAGWPLTYFSILALAFFLDFARAHIGGGPVYAFMQWAAWFAGPPLSVLLILQVCAGGRAPPLSRAWPLALLPVGAAIAETLAHHDRTCAVGSCSQLGEWLVIAGLLVGLCSIASLWRERTLLRGLPGQPAGQTRYWLALTLIILNLAFLAFMLLGLSPEISPSAIGAIRTLLGLGLVYLAGTSLFRIYPQPFAAARAPKLQTLNDTDMATVRRVEALLDLDKIYQEPAYSRTDLARELNVTEAALSRLINAYFGKSLPQLFNDRRIADASRLLRETDLPVKAIAEQVGFASTTTFNRVFREQTGRTASEFRDTAAG